MRLFIHLNQPLVKRFKAVKYPDLHSGMTPCSSLYLSFSASLLSACHMTDYLTRNSWTDADNHYVVSYQDNCDGFGFARDTLAYDSCLRNEEMLIQKGICGQIDTTAPINSSDFIKVCSIPGG